MQFERQGTELEIAATARDFLSSRWAIAQLRDAGPGGGVPGQVWAEAATAGWFDLLIPGEQGGLGLGPVELGGVVEESGRALLPGPLLDTAVAGSLWRTERPGGRAPDIVVIADPQRGGSSGWAPAWAEFDGTSLHGRDLAASYADQADLLLVIARAEDGLAVVPVSPHSRGVRCTPLATVDFADRPCALEFEACQPVDVPLTGDVANRFVTRVRPLMWSMCAARVLGVIEQTLEMTTAYARERYQFSQPIGSFQAVQHRLADLAMVSRTLRSACYLSQASLAADLPDAGRRARIAKAYASDVVRGVVESALQAHGGIGFTWEYDLHLFFKHALTLQTLWGDTDSHTQSLAADLTSRACAPAGSLQS